LNPNRGEDDTTLADESFTTGTIIPATAMAGADELGNAPEPFATDPINRLLAELAAQREGYGDCLSSFTPAICRGAAAPLACGGAICRPITRFARRYLARPFTQ